MNIEKDIEKISTLGGEIMKISYPLCNNANKDIAVKASMINNKANDILKYIRSLETKLKLEGYSND